MTVVNEIIFSNDGHFALFTYGERAVIGGSKLEEIKSVRKQNEVSNKMELDIIYSSTKYMVDNYT